MNECDIAWLAGLLEGEGSFFMHKNQSPRVQVEMTDEDIILRARNLYPEMGKIYAMKARQEHWKNTWRWTVSGDHAVKVMTDVLPYMGERRTEKINECIDLWVKRKPRKDPELHARLEQAALEYIAGKGTHISLAEKYGTSRESVRTKILEVKARLA